MKRQNNFLIAILALGMISVSCTSGGMKQTDESSSVKNQSMDIASVSIDAGASKVMWEGTMLGVYSHEGTLDITEASLDLTDGKISGGSFTVDMNSMVATDENYNPEEGSTPQKLIGHLKSADFFDVENYPTATFTINGADENTINGMLTIRGKTNAEKISNINMWKEGDVVRISGNMTIDRKKYDVAWDSPMKDRVLSDDIEIAIELLGK